MPLSLIFSSVSHVFLRFQFHLLFLLESPRQGYAVRTGGGIVAQRRPPIPIGSRNIYIYIYIYMYIYVCIIYIYIPCVNVMYVTNVMYVMMMMTMMMVMMMRMLMMMRDIETRSPSRNCDHDHVMIICNHIWTTYDQIEATHVPIALYLVILVHVTYMDHLYGSHLIIHDSYMMTRPSYPLRKRT